MQALKDVRDAGTPIVAIETYDQVALVDSIVSAAEEDDAIFTWDSVRQFVAHTPRAADILRDDYQSPAPAFAIEIIAQHLPSSQDGPKALVLILNAHDALRDVDSTDGAKLAQELANLRTWLARRGQTIALLAPPPFELPAAIAHDVVRLSDPLPDQDALATVIDQVVTDAGVSITEDERASALDAVRGLTLFGAEQAVAISCAGSDGLDLKRIWDQKRQALREGGLQVDDYPYTFDDLGGLEAVIDFGRLLFGGVRPPRIIVRIDEIEKQMAASQTDTTGVAQDALSVLLTSMEDNHWDGMILYGASGSGKTAYSRALGATCGALTVTLDLGRMRAGLVGESERRIRAAVDVIRAVAGDRAFFVATANTLPTDALPPELRRRFRRGVWFFDLPTREEKDAIWKIARARYGIDAAVTAPPDDDWTGSDIVNFCESMATLRIDADRARQLVVPVSLSDPGGLELARRSAKGRYFSASYPGTYRGEDATVKTKAVSSRRSIRNAN